MSKTFLRLVPALAAVLPMVAAAQTPPPAVHVEPEVMARAFPAGGFDRAKVNDARVLEARDLVAKSLGEDFRDLVFIPVTPCTVWDTRFATDPQSAGIIANTVTRRFFTHLDGAGGSYEPYGGNPTCPETSQNSIGMRPYAAMLTSYVNDATGNGWVTFFRDGDPDPSLATISVYYAPGPTRTQTVISKSSRGYGAGSYDVAVTSRFASANVSASVVGYFLKPVNIVLPASTATTGNINKNGSRFIHNFGANNTFMGVDAGNYALTGHSNAGFGVNALANLTTGFGNAAVGFDAGLFTAGGNYQAAMGYFALRNNTGGIANAAFGAFALTSNTTGQYNVAVGTDALIGNLTGFRNIAVGESAGAFLESGSDNIYIGHPGVSATESNTVRIGETTEHTRVFLSGVRGVTTGQADAIPLMVDSLGQLGTISSSRLVKDDIHDMDAASSGLMRLRPVTFHYRAYGNAAALQYGLVAEEVAEVYPGLVAKKADGSAETVMYQFLPPMLLNEYQKQQRTIEEMQAKIARLEKLLEAKQ